MGRITIIELSEALESLPEGAHERLVAARTVVVPSTEGTVAEALSASGISHTSYQELGIPQVAPAQRIATVFGSLAESGDVVLALAAYPLVGEGVLMALLRSAREIDVMPPEIPHDLLLLASDVDSTADVDVVDASVLLEASLQLGAHLIVEGISDAAAAADVSAVLGEHHPMSHPAVLATAGTDACILRSTTLRAMPLEDVPWRQTTVYVPPSAASACRFDELVSIVALLRSPEGCPWDREQTHMSLRRNLIEEAYEVVAAIENGDMDELAEELGDLMLQAVLHAQIASESGEFTIDDSIEGIVSKLRRRHPHVFGTVVADTPAEVLERWDRIKRQEKEGGAMEGIAHSLPALMYADKVSRRAVAAGFDWESLDGVWDKVHEEIEELKATSPGTDEAADEIGDVLFSVVNLARKMGVDAEEALRGTCEKFKRRFGSMEDAAAGEGRELSNMRLDEMETLWSRAKAAERMAGEKGEEAR